MVGHASGASIACPVAEGYVHPAVVGVFVDRVSEDAAVYALVTWAETEFGDVGLIFQYFRDLQN